MSANGTWRGAAPHPAGASPLRPGPLSLLLYLCERSSPSRVRFAAHNPRALDRSGPFQKPSPGKRERGQNGKAKPCGPPVGRPAKHTPALSASPRLGLLFQMTQPVPVWVTSIFGLTGRDRERTRGRSAIQQPARAQTEPATEATPAEGRPGRRRQGVGAWLDASGQTARRAVR